MSADLTIRMLAAGASAADAREWHAKAARIAWVGETVAALRAAQREMDECLAQSVRGIDEHGTGTEAVARLSKEAFNRLFDAEQAKVTAIRAQLDAAIDEDRWPRHLHFGRF